MIDFAENLNKMITAGLGGETEAPRTEVAVGNRTQYMDASGPLASFDTNIVAPLKKLLVTMLPIQEGTGDPSPDNVRPLTGRDSVTVYRTGKNLLPAKFYVGIPYNANVGTQFTPTEINDVVQSGNTFTRTLSTAWGGFGMISAELPTGTYKCKIAFTANAPRSSLYVLDGNMKVTRRIGNMSVNGTWAREITITDGEKYIAMLVSTSSAGTVTVTEPQIEFGSTTTDYEVPQIQFVTIPLGDTVYGGTLDVTTGHLIVTHGEIASYAGETLPGEWISDRDVYAAGTSPTIGAQVVYELADPVEIDLTPEQVATLIGDNNVWSDTGDVDVTYVYYEETEGY